MHVAVGLVAVGLLTAACSSTDSGTDPGSAGYGPAPATQTSSSSPSPSNSSNPGGAGSATTLTISGFSFSSLTVKPGARVQVKNEDAVEHTVTIGGTKTDVDVPASGTATFTAPTKSGDYPLTCDFHATMSGSLTVAS